MRALFKLGFDLVEAGGQILLDTVCCGIANQCAMAGHDYFCMAIILFSSFSMSFLLLCGDLQGTTLAYYLYSMTQIELNVVTKLLNIFKNANWIK